ncbi:MAG: hypothetical protein AB7G87_12500 [Clostridia bacterium]
MWVLLIIGGLIPFVYFGYLVSKLDKFLAQGGFAMEDDKMCPIAIVLGQTELAKQITNLLREDKIPVFPLTEPFLLEREKNFCYLFALSENDADNIVLCKIGKKVYGVNKMISLCNDRRNEGMFISERIRYLSGENITAQTIYRTVLQETEAKS